MQTLETHTTYTFEELLEELNRVRPGGMARSTLYNWIKKLSLLPTIEGVYTKSDLETLKDLSRFLQNCPSIDKFIKVYFGH